MFGRITSFLLKKLSILGFHKEADYIANKWEIFISTLNFNPEIEYNFAYPTDLIDRIAQIFVEGLNQCHFSNLTPKILQNAEDNSIVKLLNDAWSIFLEEKDRYTDWEQLHIGNLKFLL